MPSFALIADTGAPVEEVWKLLHDPARFPEWWCGVETVQPDPGGGGYTMWPEGYPDSPMRQRLQTEHARSRVTISCLVFDLEFHWQLGEIGDGTRIEVLVRIPEAEAYREATQRELVEQSIRRLAELAVLDAAPPR